MPLEAERRSRLAILAQACGDPLAVATVAALSARGAGRAITIEDLALELAPALGEVPGHGPLFKRLDLLKKLNLLDMDQTGARPTNVTCAIKEDGILGELSDLAREAQEDSLASLDPGAA